MERIRPYLSTLLILIGGCFALNTHAENLAATPSSPIGYWKAIDNTTGKTKSIIQIWQAEDKTLKGKVVKVFPSYQAKHDQAMLGTVILTGLMAHENQWKGGNLIDPENGKSYQCTMGLAENGKKLNLKGFTAGIPLLDHLIGHSQTWERVDLMSDAEAIQK